MLWLRRLHPILEPRIRETQQAIRSRTGPTGIPLGFMLIRLTDFRYFLLLVRLDLIPEHLPLGTYAIRSCNGFFRRLDFLGSVQLHRGRISLCGCIRTCC